jgi:RNA polymerase sigma factor (sigma-70 family)
VDRDDIVQETFIAAYEKLAQLKEKERFEAWLCRIADNVLRKWHRRQIVQVEFDEACLDTAGAPVVSRDTESGDLMIAHLRTALKRLSVQHRQMLLHHYVQQRSYADSVILGNCEASDFPDMEQARLIVGITEASLQIDGRETRMFPIIEAEYPQLRKVFPETCNYSLRLTAETVSGLIAEVEPYLEGRHPRQDGWSYYPLAEFSLNVTAQELSVRVGKVMGYSGEGKSIDLLMPDVPHWEHTTTVKGQTKKQLAGKDNTVVVLMAFTLVTHAISSLCYSPSDYIEIQIVDSLSPVVFRSSSQCDDISLVMPARPD